MPPNDGGSDPDVFDILPPVPPAKPGRTKQTNLMPASAPAMEAAVGPAGVAPVLSYARTSPADAARINEAFPEIRNRWRDIYIPAALILIAFGVLLAAIHRDNAITATLLVVGAFVVTKAVVMTIAVPAMTRFADVSFGRISPALLKLGAIGLLPDAAAFSVFRWADACSGVLLSIPAAVITGWLLFRFLCEFDFAEAMWCTVALTVITLVPYLLWWQLFLRVIRTAM